jgi:hypothetical protein
MPSTSSRNQPPPPKTGIEAVSENKFQAYERDNKTTVEKLKELLARLSDSELASASETELSGSDMLLDHMNDMAYDLLREVRERRGE